MISPIFAFRSLRPPMLVRLLVLLCLGTCCRPKSSQSAAPAVSASADAAPASEPVSENPGALVAQRFLGRGCALEASGEAWCWRDPLPAGHPRERPPIPRRAPELDRALDFVRTDHFSYILRPDKKVYVWGAVKHSYLGDVRVPKAVPGLESVREIASFGMSGSALSEDGTAFSWSDVFISPEPGEPGEVISGKLELVRKGVRSLASPRGTAFISDEGGVYAGLPQGVRVQGLESATGLASCGSATCALLEEGRIECWRGQIELPPNITTFPIQGPGQMVSLSCSLNSELYALRADGTLWMHPLSFSAEGLKRIPTLKNIAEVSPCQTGECPHCVRFRDKRVACWDREPGFRLGSGEWPANPELAVMQKNVDSRVPATLP